MGYPINIDMYRTVRIENLKKETALVKTFTFKDRLCNRAKIGQYIMLWIQGIDEIPISLSKINHKGFSSITVEKVGEATAALHLKEIGDFISIRGPYGSSFRISKGNVLVVGGGVGVAPLIALLDGLAEIRSDVTLIVGAKTKADLISLTKIQSVLEAINGRLIVTTEDGSYGVRGLATEPLVDILDENTFDVVYTCGPEPMMRRVFEIAESSGVEVQACFERIIRCSVGLCGSCVIGRLRVCKDGPILFTEQLRDVLEEFGTCKRSFDGSRVSL